MNNRSFRPFTDEEADWLVEEWHSDSSLGCGLHEYLGWTWEEYAKYVENGELPKTDL